MVTPVSDVEFFDYGCVIGQRRACTEQAKHATAASAIRAVRNTV